MCNLLLVIMSRICILSFRTLPFVGILAVGLASCETKTQQSSEIIQAQADSTTKAVNRIASSNQSELFRTIIGVPAGDFRGFNFGDPVAKIKASETFEMFEDSTDHVGFTYETENVETIDVLYYLDKNQAFNSAQIDVYLVTEEATKQLWDQFDTYLSGKYTLEKRQGKRAFWRHHSGKRVSLEDVSKGKDFGIRFIVGDKALSLSPTKTDA